MLEKYKIKMNDGEGNKTLQIWLTYSYSPFLKTEHKQQCTNLLIPVTLTRYYIAMELPKVERAMALFKHQHDFSTDTKVVIK